MSNNPISLSLVFVQSLSLIFLFITGPVISANPLYFLLQILLMIVGVWSIWEMRKSRFQVTSDIGKDSRLVKTGPYKYIRHPMYAVILAFTFILILNTFSYIRLASWLILFSDLLFKLSYEETLLEKHFHDYHSYQKHTKKFIPGIY